MDHSITSSTRVLSTTKWTSPLINRGELNGPIGTPPTYLWYNASDSDNQDLNDGYYNNFKTNIWPVCFPRNDDEYPTKRGFIAGWLDLPPQIVRDPLQLGIESFTYQGVK